VNNGGNLLAEESVREIHGQGEVAESIWSQDKSCVDGWATDLWATTFLSLPLPFLAAEIFVFEADSGGLSCCFEVDAAIDAPY